MSYLFRTAMFLGMVSCTAEFASAACNVPNRDVTVQKAARPDVSSLTHQKQTLTAVIDVSVAPSGKATTFRVGRSSGNAAFDQVATNAARQSTYLPKLVNCKAVAGEYSFRVSFDPNS